MDRPEREAAEFLASALAQGNMAELLNGVDPILAQLDEDVPTPPRRFGRFTDLVIR